MRIYLRSIFAAFCRRLGVATSRDVALGAKTLSKQLERLERQLDSVNGTVNQLRRRNDDLADTVATLKTSSAKLQRVIHEANDQTRRLALARTHDFTSLGAVHHLALELEQNHALIAAHIQAAVDRAIVETDPFPYVRFQQLLPESFYDRIVNALPPDDYWRSSGQSRDYWEIETDVAPRETEVIWRFVDRQIVNRVLRPLIVEAFNAYLAVYWRDAFGVDGRTVTYRAAEGRLQRRRRGYLLRPHLDPPHAAMTGLLYLARPDDDPKHGTRFYKPSSPLPFKRKGIYYPDDDGITLEHAVTVPFYPNTLVAWMTSLGPHGADLTASDIPKSIERYTYQFQLVTDDVTRRRIETN